MSDQHCKDINVDMLIQFYGSTGETNLLFMLGWQQKVCLHYIVTIIDELNEKMMWKMQIST